MRKATLPLCALLLLAACGAKSVRYDAGAFQLLVPKKLVVEQAANAQETTFSVRLGFDGPVCATLQLLHQGGGACSSEELALQHGTAPRCDERFDDCSACVELDGAAAQLRARTVDELECAEAVRGLFESLQVKPALHR
jgi:hypothetical protein